MTQCSRSMADRSDGLPCSVKLFDKPYGVPIFSQIPQWTVAAGIEHGIKV